MASFFEWDPAKYALGVSAMDKEHQTLIGLMNKLHALYSERAGKPAIGNALQELAKYTVKHFADEEAHMASIKFADLKKHKNIHADLLKKVEAHVASFNSSGQLTDEFFSFLRFWLKAHICNIDQKYAAG